jgi:hypothetical protein
MRFGAHPMTHENGVMERAYSPYFLFVLPFPGALPQADIVRAFGALFVFRIGIATNAICGGPKARSIAAWGNAPGIERPKTLKG